LIASRLILRFLAVGRQGRTMAKSPTHGAEVRARLDTREVQPRTRVSFIAAERDRHAGRVDAVAGSEFVDDRIRLRE